MFSGIVETYSPLLKLEEGSHIIQIHIQRPKDFDDLKVGDSIAVNGVCLTLESFDEDSLQFALAPETLRVTGWNLEKLKSFPRWTFNLERSLRFGDRIHGHLVSGHVDGVGAVAEIEAQGEALEVRVTFPLSLKPLLWKKGSVAVNGVSLTINQVGERPDGSGWFSLCLIPETLRRTNLSELQTGDSVTLEADSMARAMRHWMDTRTYEERNSEL